MIFLFSTFRPAETPPTKRWSWLLGSPLLGTAPCSCRFWAQAELLMVGTVHFVRTVHFVKLIVYFNRVKIMKIIKPVQNAFTFVKMKSIVCLVHVAAGKNRKYTSYWCKPEISMTDYSICKENMWYTDTSSYKQLIAISAVKQLLGQLPLLLLTEFFWCIYDVSNEW